MTAPMKALMECPFLAQSGHPNSASWRLETHAFRGTRKLLRRGGSGGQVRAGVVRTKPEKQTLRNVRVMSTLPPKADINFPKRIGAADCPAAWS